MTRDDQFLADFNYRMDLRAARDARQRAYLRECGRDHGRALWFAIGFSFALFLAVVANIVTTWNG